MVAVTIYWLQGKGGWKVTQKVSVTYACDYDQKEIPAGQHRVRRFRFDGRDYEIDLCAWHSDSFDETITRFAQHARKSQARAPVVKRRAAAHRQRPGLGQEEGHRGERPRPHSDRRGHPVRGRPPLTVTG